MCVFQGYFFIAVRIDCLCVAARPPYLLGLGFHADVDASGTYYLFRICFPHVIYCLLFYFFIHVR